MIHLVRAARGERPKITGRAVVEAPVNVVACRDYSMSGSRKKTRDDAGGTPVGWGVLRQYTL